MLRRRVRALVFVVVPALAVACGGNPPDREMQQAQGAIDAARAAGADEYAHDEFTAAQDALARAHQAVADRDYRLALNDALDSRERAQSAARLAADNKAAARVDADRALRTARLALAAAKTRLAAAQTARAPARTLAAARRAVAAGERTVQEAGASFDAGHYPAVTTALNGMTARLQAATSDLPPPAPARRRR